MNPIQSFLIALQRFWAAVQGWDNQLQRIIEFHPVCDQHPLQKALTEDVHRWEAKLQTLSGTTDRRNPHGFREDKQKALHQMEKIMDALDAIEVYRKAPLKVLLPSDLDNMGRGPSTHALSAARAELERSITKLRTELGLGPRIRKQPEPIAPEMGAAGTIGVPTSSTRNPKIKRNREAAARNIQEFITRMMAFRAAYQQFLDQGPKPDDPVFRASWRMEMRTTARKFEHDVLDWRDRLRRVREDISKNVNPVGRVWCPEHRIKTLILMEDIRRYFKELILASEEALNPHAVKDQRETAIERSRSVCQPGWPRAGRKRFGYISKGIPRHSDNDNVEAMIKAFHLMGVPFHVLASNNTAPLSLITDIIQGRDYWDTYDPIPRRSSSVPPSLPSDLTSLTTRRDNS